MVSLRVGMVGDCVLRVRPVSHGRAFVKCLVCGQEWMWLVLVHARGESYIVGFRRDCRDHRNVVIVNKRFQTEFLSYDL